MRILLLIVLLYSTTAVFSQTKINLTLKNQLDSVMVLDQKYRDAIMLLFTDTSKVDLLAKTYHIPPKNVTRELWKRQSAIDSANLVFIECIFKKYGYPGESLVGTPTNETAFFVIQHSSKIPQYLPLIKQAARQKELPFKLAAMMEDRYLMSENKEQIYGTQATGRTLKNGKTLYFIWPIKDPQHVNDLRKKAGFEQTVEENAKRLGVNYRVVKLSEIEL